jgi:heme/copper-type cytochrome/quinol oxidase subunit 3
LSLNSRERHALDMIEERLAASDTQLAAMLSTFSRLADGEAIPAREQIQAATQRPRRARADKQRPHRPRRLGLQVTMAVWLLISSVVIAVAVVLSHTGGKTTCTAWPVATCSNHMPAHPRANGGQRPR